MTRALSVVSISTLCVALLCPHASSRFAADGDAIQFDVNDVSYLWPVPTSKQDVAGLIAIDEPRAVGQGPLVPQAAFETLVSTAQKVAVTNSGGLENKLKFPNDLKAEFLKQSTWKVAAFRVDPSAPGTAPMLTAAFGSVPQLRLIVQPVTVDNAGAVTVHDVTAHLVYNYVKEFKKPVVDKGPPFAVPDKDQFAEIVKDLKALKIVSQTAGVATKGNLAVHPGLKNNVNGFPNQVKSFLKKHLDGKNLAAMAFMGLEEPEPWIFFAMKKDNATFVPLPLSTLAGKSSQMLILKGGTPVMPQPKTTNVDRDRGVSTALLFPSPDNAKLEAAVFPDLPGLKLKDVPDLIANPLRAHFFNTDCVSCHSESSRRIVLKLDKTDSEFRFKVPAGVSGVDESVLPQHDWNVRNFGWGPKVRMRRPKMIPTVTMRTANEAAESADFINKQYLDKK